MPPPVRLQEMVDALELQLEDASSFLHRDTGQVAIVSDDLLRAAEESSDPGRELPAWQKPEWELAQHIVATDCFEPLPTRFDVHEWAMMRDFAYSLISDRGGKTCSILSTEPGRSAISKAACGGTDWSRLGLLSAPPPSNRSPGTGVKSIRSIGNKVTEPRLR